MISMISMSRNEEISAFMGYAAHKSEQIIGMEGVVAKSRQDVGWAIKEGMIVLPPPVVGRRKAQTSRMLTPKQLAEKHKLAGRIKKLRSALGMQAKAISLAIGMDSKAIHAAEAELASIARMEEIIHRLQEYWWRKQNSEGAT